MTTLYNATAITDRPSAQVTEDLADAIMDRLASYHVALGFTDLHLRVIITLPGEDLDQAFSTALAVLHRALQPTGVGVQGVEVVSTAEFDRRNGIPPVPELLSVTEAAELLHVTGTRVRQMLDAGQLPGQKAGATWVLSRAAVERAAASRQPEPVG